MSTQEVAQELGHPGARQLLASARNSMEGPELAEVERNVKSTYQQMVRISIEPLWARFDDFGAGRLPGFLAELVNEG